MIAYIFLALFSIFRILARVMNFSIQVCGFYFNKNRLILTILQCNTEHSNVFLNIPGLQFAQIKIPRNVVDDFGTLTTWHHMKTSSLKRKDQASFGFVYASILIFSCLLIRQEHCHLFVFVSFITPWTFQSTSHN
jgi:hypothetical protein